VRSNKLQEETDDPILRASGDKEEACANAGLDEIKDHLKTSLARAAAWPDKAGQPDPRPARPGGEIRLSQRSSTAVDRYYRWRRV
jgi:hypothetical protein